MPQAVHIFRLEARFGPQDVFRVLTTLCEHPSQRAHEPRFEFDWMKRRVALSANSLEGLESCHERFMEQLRKAGAEADSLLAGKIEEKGQRWERPYGVAVMDAATFGELIGRSLIDMGLSGIKVIDSAGVCTISIRQSAMAKSLDYQGYIMQFPLPAYISIKDVGIQVQGKNS